jgi:hypothetical protein
MLINRDPGTQTGADVDTGALILILNEVSSNNAFLMPEW